MKRVFQNGDYQEYKTAVENKKALLILCKNHKTSFGLLIVDPIILNGHWSSSSLISAFNILDRKEFTGKEMEVEGNDCRDWIWLRIGGSEVVIDVNRKGYYCAWSISGGGILQITKDGSGINAITKEEGSDIADLDKLEVYA